MMKCWQLYFEANLTFAVVGCQIVYTEQRRTIYQSEFCLAFWLQYFPFSQTSNYRSIKYANKTRRLYSTSLRQWTAQEY